MVNSVLRARELGQSVWLDDLNRRMLHSGLLERLRDEGVSGITSNPTIFAKAVAASSDYDGSLRDLVRAGRTPDEILWDIMVEDVVAAADILRPVFDANAGRDGFVSIEVSPSVAHSVEATVAMARDLHRRCARPNVMVKIPATAAGVAAIRTMVAEGANINVTLIFGVPRYEEVVEAFLSGLEELRRRGGAVGRVNSVASFFVSRVDTKVDAILDARIAADADAETRARLEGLRGVIGIANSKRAYRRMRELHSGPRWEALASAGAAPQRCLWASTSVKDPRLPDTLYVDNLIGARTIDTMPEGTLQAWLDHGTVRETLLEGLDRAWEQLDELGAAGIDLDRVTAELEEEGVAAFEKSYEQLLTTITAATQTIGVGGG